MYKYTKTHSNANAPAVLLLALVRREGLRIAGVELCTPAPRLLPALEELALVLLLLDRQGTALAASTDVGAVLRCSVRLVVVVLLMVLLPVVFGLVVVLPLVVVVRVVVF